MKKATFQIGGIIGLIKKKDGFEGSALFRPLVNSIFDYKVAERFWVYLFEVLFLPRYPKAGKPQISLLALSFYKSFFLPFCVEENPYVIIGRQGGEERVCPLDYQGASGVYVYLLEKTLTFTGKGTVGYRLTLREGDKHLGTEPREVHMTKIVLHYLFVSSCEWEIEVVGVDNRTTERTREHCGKTCLARGTPAVYRDDEGATFYQTAIYKASDPLGIGGQTFCYLVLWHSALLSSPFYAYNLGGL